MSVMWLWRNIFGPFSFVISFLISCNGQTPSEIQSQLASASPSPSINATEDEETHPSAQSATLKVNVAGLGAGKSLTISEGSGSQMLIVEVSGNGTFAIGESRKLDSQFSILVAVQPAAQTCIIVRPTGTLSDDTVVEVDCSDMIPINLVSVTPPADGQYKLGDNLDFTVAFEQAVLVTGNPQLNLVVGAAQVSAAYLSGSGSANLIFRLTVAAEHFDNDGISASGSIALDAGTILGENSRPALNTFPTATYGEIKIWTAPNCSTFVVGSTIVSDDFDDGTVATNSAQNAVGTGWGIVTNANITATEMSSRLSVNMSGGSMADFDQYKINSSQKQAFMDSQGIRVQWTTAPVTLTQASTGQTADYAPMPDASVRYQLGFVDSVRSNGAADNQFWRLPQANGGNNGGGGFYVDLYFKQDPNDVTKLKVGGAINVATVEKTQRTETTTSTNSAKIGANGLGTFLFDEYDGSTPLTITAVLDSTGWKMCLSQNVTMIHGDLRGTWAAMPTPFTHNEFETSALVTYGNAVFTARASGVTLAFDGSATVSSVVDAWNSSHPNDHVTWFSKPGLGTPITGTYVPPAGSAVLANTSTGGFATFFTQALATGGRGTTGLDRVVVERGAAN